MTTGALIFAFNNEATDYVSMAAWNAKRIRRYLDIPVAIVTDKPTDLDFDQVILAPSNSGGSRYFEDYNQQITWHNASRVNAFDLSPWDQTLLVDADYVVNSNDLQTILQSPQDFLAHNWAYDITGRDMTALNFYGHANLRMWWATVIMFRRTNIAQYIFSMMELIRNNWQHYRELYGITKATYRNDFALSIALQLINGCNQYTGCIPWPLASVLPNTHLEYDNGWAATYQSTGGKPLRCTFNGLDFHAMGKRDLEKVIASR